MATYGGASCTIPTSAPGASTLCTAQSNGFCLIDTLDIANARSAGVCVCYSGYSGDKCQTQASTSSSNTNNALGALALGGLGAYLLTQLMSEGSGGSHPGNQLYADNLLYGDSHPGNQLYADNLLYGKDLHG
ncbi:uncharacterized protein LOC130052863 [Ostrea edulis]|uniref:uncharacterized protein LOC130052863 n=1 Tax=Ostrea edulis TaxID=37623 RepID=UPI0024AF6BAA|nr:uncharacterized protein LOC130052863 [Ostrea edulis]